MWITNGGVANWYFVLARTDPDPKARAGTEVVYEGGRLRTCLKTHVHLLAYFWLSESFCCVPLRFE